MHAHELGPSQSGCPSILKVTQTQEAQYHNLHFLKQNLSSIRFRTLQGPDKHTSQRVMAANSQHQVEVCIKSHGWGTAEDPFNKAYLLSIAPVDILVDLGIGEALCCGVVDIIDLSESHLLILGLLPKALSSHHHRNGALGDQVVGK